MLKTGIIFRGRAYVKFRGSWRLLARVAEKCQAREAERIS